MRQRQISNAVIKRLPRYHRYLGELLSHGVERISSGQLSAKMGVTASQIRQDLNHFGGFGQQGYGYNVQYLYTEIGNILGLNVQHNWILVGAGNLGRAMANYENFENRGFILKGIFDKNPDLTGELIRGIPIRPMEELEQFLMENDIEIAALAIPKEYAGDVAQRLVKGNIRGFINFAHMDLVLPKDVVVENVHLSENLMRLTYRISQHDRED